MKARWLIITLLLAFPFAFAFFLSEARLGQQRTARRVLIIPTPIPVEASKPTEPAPASDISPIGPISPIAENPPAPSSDIAATTPPPPIENQVTERSDSSASKIETPPALLLEGTVTKESNALVYESDARLQLPNNIFLSSPTGVMVSDEQQKIFAGDMQLLTTRQTISANEAVLTLQPGGSSVLTSKTLSIASNDDSTPAMELKGDNLTLTMTAQKTPQVTGNKAKLTFPPVNPPVAPLSETPPPARLPSTPSP